MNYEALKQEKMEKKLYEIRNQVSKTMDLESCITPQSIKRYEGLEKIIKIIDESIKLLDQQTEDNNSWTRIEADGSNLPTKKGDYYGCYPDGDISCFLFNPEDDFDRELFLNELTHYQEIKRPNPPKY